VKFGWLKQVICDIFQPKINKKNDPKELNCTNIVRQDLGVCNETDNHFYQSADLQYLLQAKSQRFLFFLFCFICFFFWFAYSIRKFFILIGR